MIWIDTDSEIFFSSAWASVSTELALQMSKRRFVLSKHSLCQPIQKNKELRPQEVAPVATRERTKKKIIAQSINNVLRVLLCISVFASLPNCYSFVRRKEGVLRVKRGPPFSTWMIWQSRGSLSFITLQSYLSTLSSDVNIESMGWYLFLAVSLIHLTILQFGVLLYYFVQTSFSCWLSVLSDATIAQGPFVAALS